MNVQPRHSNLHDRPSTAATLAPPKRPGFFGRMVRRIRKHPLVTAAIVAALGVGGGYVIQARTAGGGGTAIAEPAVRGDVEEGGTALGRLTALKSGDVG